MFSTGHLSLDLKKRSVRGGAVTFGSQGVRFVVTIVSTMVLARLLSPEDFGIVAMVSTLTGFIMVFKDLGLSMATVQRSEINHSQVSALFWVNIAISLILTIVTLVSAPMVAWFYDEPKLKVVTIILSSAFIFSGLTAQHQALLRRQMRMQALAFIDILSVVISVISAIACAYLGLAYWSLVVMQISSVLVTAVGVWIACEWRPGKCFRISSIKDLLFFGGNMTCFSVVNYFARNLDNIIVGRILGAQSLGVYSRAYSLLLFPLGQITAPMTAVAIPALSHLVDQPERYCRYYLKAISLICYISMPLVAIMCALSSEIICIVMGESWRDASPIFMIFCFAAIIQPVDATTGWIFVSRGQTNRMFALSCVITPLLILSFVVGVHWGVIGVAIGYSLSCVIVFYPSFLYALKGSPVVASDVIGAMLHPLAASIVIGMSVALTRINIIASGHVIVLLVSTAVGLMVTACMLFMPSIRSDVKVIRETVNLIFNK
jgi:O-antigen/teichoic acid export membrane protein